MSEENGAGKDHLGLVERMILGTSKIGGVASHNRVCQCDTSERQYRQECCVVDEVNGSPPRTMGFSVINRCEVKLTAREATTMTLWVFVSRPRWPLRVTAVS